jgi:Mn-dependent DtxR family transcriptional regulator
VPGKPSQSAEDYLERIHELIESKGNAHVADIAQSLNVGQPSVTSMVQKLADAGYLRYEKYRALTLTDDGRAVAERIRDRHVVLASFFTLFGLDDETQARDIEGIEHHLSPDTLNTLADLTEFFKDNPKTLAQFQSDRKNSS